MKCYRRQKKNNHFRSLFPQCFNMFLDDSFCSLRRRKIGRNESRLIHRDVPLKTRQRHHLVLVSQCQNRKSKECTSRAGRGGPGQPPEERSGFSGQPISPKGLSMQLFSFEWGRRQAGGHYWAAGKGPCTNYVTPDRHLLTPLPPRNA